MLFATRIIVSNCKFSMLSTQVERATIVKKPEQISFGFSMELPRMLSFIKGTYATAHAQIRICTNVHRFVAKTIEWSFYVSQDLRQEASITKIKMNFLFTCIEN